MNCISLTALAAALTAMLVGVPIICPSSEATKLSVNWAEHDVPTICVQSPVDDAFVQSELSRLGGQMVEQGQLLPKAELLKRRLPAALALPKPAATLLDEAALAEKCRQAVVVVARLTRLGEAKQWTALPASGFFIASTGAFVTSSHSIHDPDYEGMVVLTGNGRVLPVRAVLADDELCDVAILQADGGPVEALPLEASAEAGTRVAVMSHPVGRFFTFAQGTVTRRSLRAHGALAQELLEISADFGPGSSGAPVVNSRGNAVGWVDTLLVWPADAHRDTTRSPRLTFRECGVTADLLRLVQPAGVGISPSTAAVGNIQSRVNPRDVQSPK